MRMELHGISWYVNLYSGINTNRDINGPTPVCTILKQSTSCAQARPQPHRKEPINHVYIEVFTR